MNICDVVPCSWLSCTISSAHMFVLTDHNKHCLGVIYLRTKQNGTRYYHYMDEGTVS